jgi:tRNA/rRNA methyltransferase
MADSTHNLDQVTIVLHRPKLPENVGAAARAAWNMGIQRLLLVDPENCDRSRILKMATRCAGHLVEDMEVYSDLATALKRFHYVVGTTARTGGQRRELKTPREMAGELVSVGVKNQIALLFGPEDRGLTNADLQHCHVLVTIPTAGFSSLNLAQAVMILCYELLVAAKEPADCFVSRLASRGELEEMYEHLQETLIKINFISTGDPTPAMRNVRRFFSRVGLCSRDIRLIRGICRQIDWYVQRRTGSQA